MLSTLIFALIPIFVTISLGYLAVVWAIWQPGAAFLMTRTAKDSLSWF